MLHSCKFSDKRILLIDKEPKTKNDRTWCFWEDKPGFFEEIVYKRWESISFLSDDYSSSMKIAPYQYKMIRGIDFYKDCFADIEKCSNVEVVYATIDKWNYEKELAVFFIDGKEYPVKAGTVFNSIYDKQIVNNKTIKLLQHFKGWVIETNKPVFSPEEATMMDFRVKQRHGTSFAYVLPFSSTSALIEYTLFTKDILPQDEYDKELADYIQTFLGVEDYKIRDQEFGVIPMTNEKLSFFGKGWQIGTAGGQTKASTGFTFQFIQKQSQQIVNCLLAGKSLENIQHDPRRFKFYDDTLLHILYFNKLPGHRIFSRLFQKNKPQQVLRFLDNESSLKEELKIISSLPTWPFLKAALKQL